MLSHGDHYGHVEVVYKFDACKEGLTLIKCAFVRYKLGSAHSKPRVE